MFCSATAVFPASSSWCSSLNIVHRFFFVIFRGHNASSCMYLILCGGNLGVILVQVCESVFEKLLQWYTWSLKGIASSCTWLNKMFTYSYTVLTVGLINTVPWFLYTPFAVCKQILQINNSILFQFFFPELNILAYTHVCVLLNMDVRKRDHSYINDEKNLVSHIGFS